MERHVAQHPDGEQIRKMEAQVRRWSLATELQLLAQTDVDPGLWRAYTGRAQPPKFKFKPYARQRVGGTHYLASTSHGILCH